MDRERQIPAPVVQGPGELAPPPQAEATHQSFSSASSPQRRASLPPPLRAPPLRAPPLIPRKPRQHPASRASESRALHGASFCRKAAKRQGERASKRTLCHLATAIMRTESRAASLPATSANSAEFFEASAKNTRFLDPNFGDQTGFFPIDRSYMYGIYCNSRTSMSAACCRAQSSVLERGLRGERQQLVARALTQHGMLQGRATLGNFLQRQPLQALKRCRLRSCCCEEAGSSAAGSRQARRLLL